MEDEDDAVEADVVDDDRKNLNIFFSLFLTTNDFFLKNKKTESI